MKTEKLEYNIGKYNYFEYRTVLHPFIRHGLLKFECIGYYYQNKQKGF
jgi:hypothetical protein